MALRPLAGPEIPEFLAASRDGYIADRVTSGDDHAIAERAAEETIATMFPGGEPGPGHLLFRVEEDNQPVGSLWIGPEPIDRSGSWWVFDITIDEQHRGRGLGKEAMLLAEREARSNGATKLGLNVFGNNTVVRHLYETLGYGVVAIRMSKSL